MPSPSPSSLSLKEHVPGSVCGRLEFIVKDKQSRVVQRIVDGKVIKTERKLKTDGPK